MPTWSSSTPVRSSRRPGRSRSTPPWRWPTPKRRRPARAHRLHGRALRRPSWPTALPEADAVVGFAGEGSALAGRRCMGASPRASATCSSCPGPAPTAPWAYVKVAEGCDRACAFCAIPSFRGKQRSRVDRLDRGRGARRSSTRGVAEIVLVAQDLAWYGRDVGEPGSLAPLLRRLDALAPRRPGARAACSTSTRARCATRSSRRCSSSRRSCRTSTSRCSTRRRRCCARMKRWGSGERFVDLIDGIRAARARRRVPVVVHRRVPGRDRARPRRAARVPRDGAARLGRASSPSRAEDGTPAATLDGEVPDDLAAERLRECSERAGPDHAGAPAMRSSARRSRCSSTASTTTTRRARRAHAPRGARDRRGRPARPATRSPAPGASCPRRSPRPIGPDLVAQRPAR